MSDIEIVIPVHTTRHPMLADCVRNVRATAGIEPIVWESAGNVSVCRNDALDRIDARWVVFLDTDAFPQERGWHTALRDAAERSGAAIANPVEISDFGSSQYRPSLHDSVLVNAPRTCGGFCLLVDRARTTARFDDRIGYESDFLGPCLEDTDFARTVAEGGGSMLHEASVSVLHKDRGAENLEELLHSHEAFCYDVVGMLIDAKHRLRIPDLFDGLGKVPGNGRFLAGGYGRDDLLRCFDPVLSNLPGDLRRRFCRRLETHSCFFFR